MEILPGVVKAGEVITLGWNYYESRLVILNVLIDFDARKDLAELHSQLKETQPDDSLQDFYKLVIERWTTLGFVREVKVVHEFKGSPVPLLLEDADIYNWELGDDLSTI